MKRILKYQAIVLLIIFSHLNSGCKHTGDSPNIVFIFPDQYRSAAMGFMEQDPVITPNIDRLASQGLVFTDATSTMPVCSPYRAMLMTGNYYTVNNVPLNCLSANPGNFLRSDDHTILDALVDADYYVGYIGKWHLEEPFEPYVSSGNNGGPGKDNWEEWTPPERRHGVQFWYAYNTFDNHFKPHYWTNNSTRENRLEIEEWSPVHETSVAIDFIKNNGNSARDPKKPFALFISYNPPHTGYSYVPERYREHYQDLTFEELSTRLNIEPGSPGEKHAMRVLADYFACVTGVDEQVGRIMNCLEEEGIRENTILVFTSDHGNCLGSHNQVTKNVFWEEAFNVPLIISWPGKIKTGKTDLLFSPVDFFPTLASFAGLETGQVQGSDLSERILYGTGYKPDGALYAFRTLSKEDTMAGPFSPEAWGERGLRTKEYMLVVNKMPDRQTEYFLSDLKNDPYQLNNIALQNRQMVETMLENQLNPKLKSIGDSWWEIPVTTSGSYPRDMRAPNEGSQAWGLK